MVSEVPNPPRAAEREEIALTSYMNAIVALANCMSEVCPQEGLIFSDRLRRLPRRLAFDATPRAIAESREALEADLAEYAQTASAWIDSGAELAKNILADVEGMRSGNSGTPALHAPLLEDLADQMEVSAEVDAEQEMRAALRQCAASLRSYLRGRKGPPERPSADLEHHAARLAAWLERANPANSTDAVTGLLNRGEIEKQLQACLHTSRVFSVLVFEWGELNSDTVVKQLADNLVALVRPRDIVGRWSANQLAVIFECPASEAMARAAKISEWLSGGYSVVVDGAAKKIKAQVAVAVVEHRPGDALTDLMQRIGGAVTERGGGSSREQVPA